MKNDEINWFGASVKGKVKVTNNSVNFLGNTHKTTTKKNVSKNVNFFGFGKKNNYKMKPASMFKKESIKKKKLSKWGDADLDGTPNYFDCDARKAFKDAKNIRGPIKGVMTVEEISALRYENQQLPSKKKWRFGNIDDEDAIFGEVKKQIALRKKEEKKEKIDQLKSGIRKTGRIIKETFGFGQYSPLEESKEEAKKAILVRKQLKKEYDSQYRAGIIDAEEYSGKIKGLNKAKALEEKRAEKVSDVEISSERLKGIMKMPGLKGQAAIRIYNIDTARAKGEQPKAKDLQKLAEIERKMKMFGDIQQEGKFSRDILTKAPGGQIVRALTGAGVDKSGEYSRELKAKSQRVRRMTAFATGALFGDNILRTRFDSEPRPRGRPPGPSGEYKIGGKPVYEEEFQQYSIKQNALNRMLPTNVQSQSLNPEYIAYMKAKAIAEQQGLGEGQMENPELTRARQMQQMTEDGVAMTEEGMPMEAEIPTEEEMPTTGTSMMQSGQEQELIKQRRAYTRAMPDEIKAAQQQAQQMDNVLNAPNFMKGELKATGGSVLTPIGPSILEAPNSFKGEMRNVTKPNIDEGEVKLGERPQTNPYGSEYLDIELGSGKPVLRRRITEKWMDGRAL
jgi:hypothetical protein